MLRALQAVLLWLCLLLPVFSRADSCLWYADEDSIHQLSTDTNQVTLTVYLKEPRRLAMNARDCGVWALTEKRLFLYDANGNPVQQVDLRRLDKRIEDAHQLALDPYDESLWLADERKLFHASAGGALLGAWAAPGEVRQLALALDQSLWVLGHRQLWHFDPQGSLLATVNLHGLLAGEPQRLALDSLGNVIWLAAGKRLVQVNLQPPARPPLTVTLPHEIHALALDALSGELWVATSHQLRSYGRDGKPIHTVDLKAPHLQEAKQLAFDPVSRSLWADSERGLSRFSAEGEFVLTLPIEEAERRIEVPAFLVSPTLMLLNPPQNALTNNPQSMLTLGYDANCNGARCGFDKRYFGSYSLTALLNNQPIGNLFTFDASTGQASYTTPTRLPEGTNVFSAQVKDSFGHLSNTVTNTFTVDTIPPKFLTLTPAEGSILANPQVTLQGSLDDPNATIVLDGTGPSPTRPNFAFPVTLRAGINTFNLSAIDRAGNVATAVLHLTLGGISVNIVSPASGAIINADSLTVSGTFQGPDNTGITVNGAVAAISGNQFIAPNVPLVPGTNTITVKATTADGLTAIKSITLTSTGAPPIKVTASPAQGIAPLSVSFSVANPTGNAIRRIDADFDDNGNAVSTSDPGSLAFTYVTPGTYQARFTVTDSQGNTYTSTQTIVVQSIANMDAMLRSTYTGMLGKLKAGDVDGALAFVTGGIYEKFKVVFNVLKPDMASIVDQLGTIQGGLIGDAMADYVLLRDTPDGPRAFHVYFIRSEDGVWRIDGM